MILPKLTAHDMILEQIEQLLQRRVIQELELLRDRLRTAPRQTASLEEPIIRVLTPEELHSLMLEKTGDLAGGATIFLFRPETTEPGATDTSAGVTALHHSSIIESPSHLIKDRSSPSSSRLVPLYDTSFLASDTKRIAHSLLKEILRTETRVLRKITGSGDKSPMQSSIPGQQAAPQAYLLQSTATTLKRVDTVPLCISLWRLRLWAGQGWNNTLWGPWELPKQTSTASMNP